MARVSVTVNVRDLTRNELARMRHNFRALSQDMTRAVGVRNRQNWDRLSQSVSQASRDLSRLRGNIPDAEFMRLDDAIRRASRTMSRGFGRVGSRAFARLTQNVQEVVQGFQDLDRHAQIRVRMEPTALDRADQLLSQWRQRQSSRAVNVRTDVDTNRMSRRLRSWAMGPLRGLGGLIGGTLSDGIGQGIVGAFRSPTFGAILVAAILAALSMVGAALAGILVLAIGGAFVGLGAVIAAKSKEVTRNWEAELNRLKPLFREAAEPMIPVLHRATHILGDMGAEFAPKLKEALEKAAPHLDNFVDSTRRGLQKLGAGAWDKLQEAFRVFLDAFGPEWEDFLMELGKSLGKLADTVKNHSTEMAMALRLVLGVINGIIELVNFFANAWVMSISFMLKSTEALFSLFAMITDAFMQMIDSMMGALEIVASAIGMDGPFKMAREGFNAYREHAVGQIQGIADRAKMMGDAIDYNNRRRVLEVDITSWTSELERAKEELKSVPPEKRTELLGRIADLEGKIASATRQLNGMQKDYYVRIHAYKVGDWALVGGGGPGMAHGGIAGHVGRAATGGARSNMTLVGEQGPELVNLAPGSHVRSNGDSRRLMSGESAERRTVFEFKSSGRRVDDLLVEILREIIHQRGGDPVTVLGGKSGR